MSNPNSQLTVLPPAESPAVLSEGALSIQQMLGQIALIQQVMTAAMKDGEHYGRIPGCGPKPTLLKPGAEKLCLLFRLAPSYIIHERDLDGGHREYRITARLASILTGAFIGEGVGVGSTREAKYLYRKGEAQSTGQPVPKAYWDLRQDDPAKAQELIGGKGYTVTGGKGQPWMIAKGGEKVENDNPADVYNTILKMAKKRALVDAVLTATAASDIFTQDLDDLTDRLAAHQPPADSAPAPAPAPAPTPAAQQPQDRPALLRVPSMSIEHAREVVLHVGKHRGLALGELSAAQIEAIEAHWLPVAETYNQPSEADCILISALRAYRAWAAANPQG